MKKEEKIDELEMARRLHRKYSAPAWAFLKQVRRGTGYSTITRTADAVAMSLYPSRGFEINGFEIKTSKADWKNELRDPKKAEEIQQFCHRWWVAIPKKDLIKLSEVPQNWGLIVAQKSCCIILKDAPLLEPKMVDYPFLAAIFRNQEEKYVHIDELDNKVEEMKKSWGVANAYELKSANKRLKALEEFEEEVGIPIDSWDNNHKRIGELAKQLVDMKDDLGWKFDRLHEHAQDIVDAFKGIEKETKGILNRKREW